jgi:hypothetical protein
MTSFLICLYNTPSVWGLRNIRLWNYNAFSVFIRKQSRHWVSVGIWQFWPRVLADGRPGSETKDLSLPFLQVIAHDGTCSRSLHERIGSEHSLSSQHNYQVPWLAFLPHPSFRSDAPGALPEEGQVQAARIALVKAASHLILLAQGPGEFIKNEAFVVHVAHTTFSMNVNAVTRKSTTSPPSVSLTITMSGMLFPLTVRSLPTTCLRKWPSPQLHSPRPPARDDPAHLLRACPRLRRAHSQQRRSCQG